MPSFRAPRGAVSRPSCDALLSITYLLGAGSFTALVGVGMATGVGTPPVATVAHLVVLAALCAGVARAARESGQDAATRSAWSLMAAGAGLILLRNVAWAVDVLARDTQPYRLAPVVVSTAGRFLFLVGALRLPTVARGMAERVRDALDAATIVLGAAMVVWYFLVEQPIPADGGLLLILSGVAGGVALVLASLVVVQTRPVAGSIALPLRFAAGLILLALADLVFGVGAFRSSHLAPVPADLIYIAAYGTILAGSLTHVRRVRRHALGEGQAQVAWRQRVRAYGPLSILAIVLGYALLVQAARDAWRGTFGALLGGALVLTALAVARLVLALRENLRMSAATAAQRSESRFRSLIEHASDLIAIADSRFEIVYASPAHLGILGIEPSALLGVPIARVVHPEDLPAARDAMEGVLGSPGASARMEFRCPAADGDVRHLQTVVTNLLHDPDVRGLVFNSRDVTEARRAEAALHESEEQLRHAQKMEAVGRLAGGVAHDFNNLLTVISTSAEFLLAGLPEDSDAYADAVEIHASAQRGAALTRQLLTFSRRQVTASCELDLAEVVAGMEPLLRRLLRADIALELHHSEATLPVRADAGQLEQVLMNLVVNARDAMPEGGTLVIETAEVVVGGGDASPSGLPPGRHAAVFVRDSGHGMDAATQARMFEPFFTTKAPGNGTGLGLATVYGIVSQSGGRILVRSAPGLGSTFAVYLPIVAPAPEAAETTDEAYGFTEPARLVSGRGTILLAEDEDGVRQSVTRILERQGYRVLAARDGVEALAVASQATEPIALLLTDVVMPNMRGPELIRRMGERSPGTRVLCMSGYTDDPDLRWTIEEQGIAFLHKPFAADELARRVQELLGVAEAAVEPAGMEVAA